MIPDNFKYQYCLKLININRMARRLGIETETVRERESRGRNGEARTKQIGDNNKANNTLMFSTNNGGVLGESAASKTIR